MASRKIRALSAAAAAVALVTTLALARTVHTPVAPGAQTYDTHDKVTGTAPRPNAGSHLRGIMACGTEMSETDCEKLQMLLPM